MRILWSALISCALANGFVVQKAHSAPPDHAAGTTRQRLVGAWHFVSIDYSGPTGPLPDPVFGPDPHGVIIYDQSG